MNKITYFSKGCIALWFIVAALQATAGTSPDAAKLYTKHCSICHGDNGDGNSRAKGDMNPPPRDFTTPEAAMELSRDRMIASVTYGRPGTAMMAHEGRLSTAEISAIVDYIRDKFMRTPTKETAPASPILAKGESIYTHNCSVCHGDKGNTAFWAQNGLNPPPRNFTSHEAKSTLTKARMIHSVTFGRPGTGMMPFSKRLSKDDINAVVTFIRARFMGVDPAHDTGATPLAQQAAQVTGGQSAAVTAAPPPAHAGGIPGVDMPLGTAAPAPQPPHGGPHQGMPSLGMGAPEPVVAADMSLPLPQGLKGDVVWGREFYMKNCFTCHGVKGDGNGPRAYFNIPRPRNFTSDASRRMLNRPRVFNSITNGRVGTVMPAWGKVLTPQQVANVAEFVFRTYIHPEAGGDAKADPKDKKKKAS
jgi:mono/diheme cytochrome c family protein